MKIALNYAARSDQGRVRTSNQDSAYAGPHLLVIADGMGGPAGGDIASTVTVHELRRLDDDSFLATDMGDHLAAAISSAHDLIVSSSMRDASLEGLGTTCTAIIRSGDLMSIAHIGDSRAYRLRDGHLEQMTTDHSFVQYLIQQGQLTPEQAATHPQRSVLLRVLGDTQGRVELDRSTTQALVGDRWLLCSDGLSGVVEFSELKRLLHTYPDPDQACEKLIEAALAGGGPDNITCVVADVVDEDLTPDLPTAPITVGAAAHADEHGRTVTITPDLPTAEIPTEDDPQTQETLGEETTQPLAVAPVASVSEGKAPRKSRKKLWLSLLVTVLILGALAFAGYRALAYVRTGYTLALEDNKVVLYEGTPGDIGPLSLHRSREVLNDYTVVTRSADCQKIETSHDPKIFAEPRASRVLTCAAARTLAPSMQMASEQAARGWLTRNSLEVVVNTTTPSPSPSPEATPTTENGGETGDEH